MFTIPLLFVLLILSFIPSKTSISLADLEARDSDQLLGNTETNLAENSAEGTVDRDVEVSGSNLAVTQNHTLATHSRSSSSKEERKGKERKKLTR